MRSVVQRVKWARVSVEGRVVGAAEQGLMILLGVAQGDSEARAEALAAKIAQLRIFTDEQDKMNRSVIDVGGGCLVVSQFTLFADCRKGRRPFFGGAEAPERAVVLCDVFAEALRACGVKRVETGVFGATMQVELCNDGPVTILLDSDDLEGSRRAS